MDKITIIVHAVAILADVIRVLATLSTKEVSSKGYYINLIYGLKLTEKTVNLNYLLFFKCIIYALKFISFLIKIIYPNF